MKFQMAAIHVKGRDALLILRGKVSKHVDYLEWYCSMLGRVMSRENVEVKGSLTKWGKKVAVRKRVSRVSRKTLASDTRASRSEPDKLGILARRELKLLDSLNI